MPLAPLSVCVGSARLLVCRENNCPQCRMPMQSRRDCKKVHFLAGNLSFIKLLAQALIMLSVMYKMQSMLAQERDVHKETHEFCMQLTHMA